MLEEIGAYEAKTKLPELLRRVAAGEAFTITKRGRAIADLIPSRKRSQLKTETAIANINKARKPEVTDEKLREWKENARK